MPAVAVLTCRSNSFPFQERQMSLTESQKIGRSVARARPGPTNGIFDCKVLSRNHALMWYEDGKFYLQDTKSSNGTFVNNERLSRGSEESLPREIYSGDIIQFGVDVMESNRRGEKVTHACIIATATLYDANGTEAKIENYSNGQMRPGGNVKSLEMYQLYQYLQEALHREKMLETKLNSLEWLIKTSQEACDTGWQALIDEDRLLSRIDVLEGQLVNHSKAHSEETLRQELTALQEDKHNYETTAKESLRRVLQEKLDAVKKCSDLELSLSNTELECCHVKDTCDASQKELQQLAEKYDEQMAEISLLHTQLQEADEKQERVEDEKEDLHDKLSLALSQEAILSAKIESLQADNDFAENQLTAIKCKLEMYKEKKLDDNFADDINIDDLIPLEIMKTEESLCEQQLKEKQKEIKEFKDKIDESETSLQVSKDKVEQLQKQIETAELDSRQYVARITSLEERTCLSDVPVNFLLESALADLKIQVKESCKQNEGDESMAQHLQASITKLEAELSLCRLSHLEPTRLSPTPPSPRPHEPTSGAAAATDDPSTPSPITPPDTVTTEELTLVGDSHPLCRDDPETIQGELSNAKQTLSGVQEQLTHHKHELDLSRALVIKQTTDLHNLHTELSVVTDQSENRLHTISELQAQLKNMNNLAKDTDQQIVTLNEQLQRSQQLAKQSKADAEHLKGELATVKEECVKLREKVVTMEMQMKVSQKENLQLSSDYNKLKNARNNSEHASTTRRGRVLGANDSFANVSSHSETNQNESNISAAQDVSCVEERVSAYESQIKDLREELGEMRTDYRSIADHSRMLSLCSTIPLLALMLAVLLALYPVLETITATSS